MPTLQSRRRTQRLNTPQARAKRRATLDAKRIAGPAPVYPAAAPLNGDWLGACVNGHTVIIRLCRAPGHRSDQWAAEIDGEVIAQAAGLTLLFDMLRERLPKAPSLRMLATSLG
jgi:hypothetical protein